mmetsp:Transcript_20334/g.24643  ORF Transcript_20334/g.24643 Transcript_20334/m.24643 type:complete len:88 (-) Transcript_20334:241-504(-)
MQDGSSGFNFIDTIFVYSPAALLKILSMHQFDSTTIERKTRFSATSVVCFNHNIAAREYFSKVGGLRESWNIVQGSFTGILTLRTSG